MKSSRKARFLSSSVTTVTYVTENDHSALNAEDNKTTQIPIESSDETPISVPTSLRSPDPELTAAVKIQSAYRSHLIRSLVRKISAVNYEAQRLERLIQRQETVDTIRSDEREKLRMNEALMALLLQLDSVPGIDPTVRELRRSVSRRIVGLQEILDSVSDVRVGELGGFVTNWYEVVEQMEEGVCKERGGEELERFCVEKLGFRCLHRCLRDY